MKHSWTLAETPFFDERHAEVIARLNDWISHNRARLADETPHDLQAECAHWLHSLAQHGLLEYAAPAMADGLPPAVDLRAICLVRECLGYYAPLADFVFSMQGIGSAALWQKGDAQLVAPYVQACSQGRKVAAFALTEPDGGSDVAATKTRAVLQGDHYLLDGAKSYISNGGIADFYVVIARTEEARGASGLSALLVDADTPGLHIHRAIDIIAPHPLAEIHFDACKVPAGRLLGQPGEGFKVAMGVLDIFRSSVGAAALGMGQRALDETLARVSQRQLYGQAMAEMQTVQHKLADMATQLEAARLLVHKAAWLRDVRQRRISTEAAMAKMQGTEAAFQVVDAAVQLWGGMGITCGSVVERLYREVRPMRIYEGATEVQKTIIGRQLLKGQA
ncbi:MULTISPECIES: acyl-CoA dehydrogenase family protein [Comamonas]|jgi:acyl-CoA dehydrogenase|uniref:Acyl-CoA dehydrogenase family protein n=1 Tax=Comamonas squillarum TaxID=2977320 RepID=A0ABY5ZWL0_9BURK|nr:acyl-CoA dehydrogenase family protein [Comamonas sp. PR12]UXC18383.1 acyl-CoA dehydrogenase family protein [Comamonas sp. PR12]